MILYWKSNSRTELGFYGLDPKRNTRLSIEDINIRIAEAFAEMNDIDDDDECNTETNSNNRVTINGETIPEDNCRVIIEDVWIEKFVDLSHKLIIDRIGDIPIDSDDSDDDENYNNEIIDDTRMRKGVFEYDINDFLVTDDEN
jgi:hypothetical protein